MGISRWGASLIVNKVYHFYGGFSCHFPRQFIGITFSIYNPVDAGIDDHLGADYTGHCGAIEGGAIDIDAVTGGLDNGILLGVQAAAEFVALSRGDIETFPQAAAGIAVRDAGRYPVVSGGQDIALLDKQSPNLSAQACGTGGNEPGYVHEIFVPGWSLHLVPSHFSQSN